MRLPLPFTLYLQVGTVTKVLQLIGIYYTLSKSKFQTPVLSITSGFQSSWVRLGSQVHL